MSNLIPHDIAGTTYYACAECGACPCPRHDRWDHTETCSHRVPPEWEDEDCAMAGAGRFMLCSHCQYPPCSQMHLAKRFDHVLDQYDAQAERELKDAADEQ